MVRKQRRADVHFVHAQFIRSKRAIICRTSSSGGEFVPLCQRGEKALLWAWERGLSSSELLAGTADSCAQVSQLRVSKTKSLVIED